MDIQSELPESAFVPFEARRLRHAKVVYADIGVLQQNGYCLELKDEVDALHRIILDLFGYLVPEADHAPDAFDEQTKEFWAERYGGVGILSNGGGARCGLVGPFQVKGIGLTPLGSSTVNYWYRNGALPLYEALVDGAYSQIADGVLPFPGSRVVAVIDTGLYSLRRAYTHKDPELDEKIPVRRGLLVRESGIRPAHFSRAFYFKPNSNIKNHYPHDFERVRDCMAQLPRLMGESAWDANAYRTAIEKMMVNSAIQLAVSKAKRLMHGSLTQSNFLIGGGWIDYGTCSAVPSYGEGITTANQPSYWQEYTLYQKTCDDLCFYARKSVPDPQFILDGTSVYQKFLGVYQQQLAYSMLAQTGIPANCLKAIPPQHPLFSLGFALTEMATQERPQPYHEDFSRRRVVTHSVPAVLHTMYVQFWIKNTLDLPALPFSKDTNEQLWIKYCHLCFYAEERALERGISKQNLGVFIGLDMTRRFIPLECLYRDLLTQKMMSLVDGSNSIEDLISAVTAQYQELGLVSEMALHDPIGMDLQLAVGEYVKLLWSISDGYFVLELTEAGRLRAQDKLGNVSVSLLDGWSKSVLMTRRPNGAWAARAPYIEPSDFSDLCTSLIAFDHEQSVVVPLRDQFPDWERISARYAGVLTGAPWSETLNHGVWHEAAE